jgi:hypothetical protein
MPHLQAPAPGAYFKWKSCGKEVLARHKQWTRRKSWKGRRGGGREENGLAGIRTWTDPLFFDRGKHRVEIKEYGV